MIFVLAGCTIQKEKTAYIGTQTFDDYIVHVVVDAVSDEISSDLDGKMAIWIFDSGNETYGLGVSRTREEHDSAAKQFLFSIEPSVHIDKHKNMTDHELQSEYQSIIAGSEVDHHPQQQSYKVIMTMPPHKEHHILSLLNIDDTAVYRIDNMDVHPHIKRKER